MRMRNSSTPLRSAYAVFETIAHSERPTCRYRMSLVQEFSQGQPGENRRNCFKTHGIPDCGDVRLLQEAATPRQRAFLITSPFCANTIIARLASNDQKELVLRLPK